jgi:hypothetical protein
MQEHFSDKQWDDAIDLFDEREDKAAQGWMRETGPEVRGEKEAFFVRYPWTAFRERLKNEFERSRFRQRLSFNSWLSGLGLAASLAIVLLLVIPQSVEKDAGVPGDAGIRDKGHVSGQNPLQTADAPAFRVLQNERVLQDGAVLKAGDRLEFSVDTGAYDHLFIFGIEENGTLTPYYPEEGASLMVGRTRGFALPDHIELDEYVGQERIVALFSKRALSWSMIMNLAQQKWNESGKDLRSMADLGLAETQEAAFWFVKQLSH